MRILIINQPYWPDVVATAQHMADWTAHLAAKGHTVTVIASRSVYGQQGAVLPKVETHAGVEIHRVGSNLFRKGRILTRLVDFGLFHVRALWKAMTLPRQDVVVCLTTPPFIGVVGMLVKFFRGSRFVQYEMDLYPDIAIALGTIKKGSMAAGFFEWVHCRVLRAADRVIVLGRCMARVVASKGIAAEKMVLVTPWADPGEIRAVGHEENAFCERHNLQGKFVVMYAGNLGLGHDIQTMLAAMERLRDDAGVQFVFVGGGRRMKEIGAAVEGGKLGYVTLLDYMPREDLGEMLCAADVHVISQGEGTCGLIVPSKLYGILAAGRPSIYIGPGGTEIALTLAEGDCGTVLMPGDVEGFLAAVARLRQLPGGSFVDRAGAELARGHTKEQCVESLTRVVEGLAAGAR